MAHQASEDRVVGDGDDVGHQPEVGLVVAVEEVDGGDVLNTIVRISETSRIKSIIARRPLWEAILRKDSTSNDLGHNVHCLV